MIGSMAAIDRGKYEGITVTEYSFRVSGPKSMIIHANLVGSGTNIRSYFDGVDEHTSRTRIIETPPQER